MDESIILSRLLVLRPIVEIAKERRGSGVEIWLKCSLLWLVMLECERLRQALAGLLRMSQEQMEKARAVERDHSEGRRTGTMVEMQKGKKASDGRLVVDR
jgi:hypothetical protein